MLLFIFHMIIVGCKQISGNERSCEVQKMMRCSFLLHRCKPTVLVFNSASQNMNIDCMAGARLCFYCRALFTCQAVAAACVDVRPSSKVHPNRPNVHLLVLKFLYCNIGYWTSIWRSVFEKKIPRRTQWKLGKS